MDIFQADVSAYLAQHDIPDILHVPETSSPSTATTPNSTANKKESIPRVNGSASKLFINATSDTNGNSAPNGGLQQPPPVPPRSFEKPFDDQLMGYVKIDGNQLLNFYKNLLFCKIFAINPLTSKSQQ